MTTLEEPNAEHSYCATANEAFKQSYSSWVGFGVILAVALHFAAFTLFPNLLVVDLRGTTRSIEAVELPPEVHVPPAPEQVSRPATPKVAAMAIDENVTIAMTTFESNPVENLLPPPTQTADPAARPVFIPYDVAPKLKNPAEIRKMLQRNYPRQLKEARIEGTVVLWIYVDQNGEVINSHVKISSGYEAMDRVAQHCAGAMKFTPAKNRDKRTSVWVAQAITFTMA